MMESSQKHHPQGLSVPKEGTGKCETGKKKWMADIDAIRTYYMTTNESFYIPTYATV
jgi:hypothetical protein